MAAIAPRRYLSGVMPSCDAVRSYNRLLEPYPASYMARVTESPDCSLCFNVFSRQESAYSRGVIPSTALNRRCSRNGLWWNSFARRPSVSGSSRCCSINRQIAFMPLDSAFPVNARGRQRRQARYPACSAASGVPKNSTFSRRGRRAAHDGRQ